METRSEREPFLSELEMMRMIGNAESGHGKEIVFFGDQRHMQGATVIWKHYEKLITDGTLRVVDKVKPERNENGTWECPRCHETWFNHNSPEVGEFCICGAKIID